MKIEHILTEAEIDDLGSMNPKMRDLLSKVKASDDAKAQADLKAKQKKDQEEKQAKRQKLAKLKAEGGEELKDYIQKLKNHDWTYDYADDHRSWSRGSQERGELRMIQKEIDPDFEIWNEYAPDGYEIKKMSEAIDKDFFHKSVENGKFMKHKKGGLNDPAILYLHDLDNEGSEGKPMLVTFARQVDAEEAVKQYGGKIIRSGMGTFRIIKDSDDLDETATAGATSAGSVASVANPTAAYSKPKKRGKYGAPEAPQKKKADGTAQNALDLSNNLMGGKTIKR